VIAPSRPLPIELADDAGAVPDEAKDDGRGDER